MVIHDVFSAAKSEYDAPYVKVDSQFYCYFGTGVGGCCIHHNTPVMGKDLMAGEIGKMLVPDADGNYVMLEDIASVEAVRQNAVKSQAAKSFDDCMAKYKKGDKRAVAYLKPVLDTTARVIYNLLWAYNPDRIVIDSCCSEYSHIITQHVKSLLEQVKNEAIPIQTEVSHAVYDEYHTMHGCFYMVRSEWLKNIAKQNSN